MKAFSDKLWNWGHLETSHNACTGLLCKMTPEEFADEYGIRNAFIVSYGGNIQPPFDNMAKRFSSLREVKWSVLGDSSTPLPDDELGNTLDVINALPYGENISGGIVDDFFSPERMKRFTPEVLKKIKRALNDKGLDFWCVLYNMQLDFELDKYLECFDGITFWIWQCQEINNMEDHLGKLFALAGKKPVMLGMYLWDYSLNKPMKTELFEKQLNHYFELLKEGRTEGVIFCSNTIGDATLAVNDMLKKYISARGEEEIST